MKHELEQLYGRPDIAASIRAKQLSWLSRMRDDRMPKKLLNAKRAGVHSRGRLQEIPGWSGQGTQPTGCIEVLEDYRLESR